MRVTTKEAETIRFGKDGLVAAVVREAATGAVLTLAWMNREALERTLTRGETWFWSRSRRRLWKKGESSGHVQKVVGVATDCDRDAILVDVVREGPACHTGDESCFGDADGIDLRPLERLLQERRRELPAGSYTASLFRGGVEAIGAKVTEEAGEVVRAAASETHQRVVEEAADLVFHLAVLLAEKEVGWSEVARELERRAGRRER
jgi:phosphoribosyl-AMP cyclohydrolase / phosphoribosyl-ATP pyrophosphohydrolase